MNMKILAIALIFVGQGVSVEAQSLPPLYVWDGEVRQGCPISDNSCIRVAASCEGTTSYWEEMDFTILNDDGEVFDSSVVDDPGVGCFPNV